MYSLGLCCQLEITTAGYRQAWAPGGAGPRLLYRKRAPSLLLSNQNPRAHFQAQNIYWALIKGESLGAAHWDGRLFLP